MTTAAQPRAAALGLRLPTVAIPRPADDPTIQWADWLIVTRSHGFHVSRESIDGTRREFLLNSVGDVRIFRAAHIAIRACEEANFTARAQRLAREPLLGGSGQ
jgi:hypothetical protein